jgi:hypothetical protein
MGEVIEDARALERLGPTPTDEPDREAMQAAWLRWVGSGPEFSTSNTSRAHDAGQTMWLAARDFYRAESREQRLREPTEATIEAAAKAYIDACNSERSSSGAGSLRDTLRAALRAAARETEDPDA